MAGQPYIVVYADILLLSNFCLDFLTLWLAGRLAGRPGKGIRLALACLLYTSPPAFGEGGAGEGREGL